MKYEKEKALFLINKKKEFGNITLVKRAWRSNFKNIKAPSTNTINNIVAKFEKMVLETPKTKKVEKVTPKRLEAKIALKNVVTEKPKISIRKASKASGFSYGLCQKVLKSDLGLKPYKRSYVHQLKTPDYQKRVIFAEWFLKLPKNTVNHLICTDEAIFTLTECLNKQNNRTWATEKPFEDIEKPLQDERIHVWMAISAEKVYGVHVFNETVNMINYLEMLQTFFWPKHLRTSSYEKYWFQQDGAPAHTAIIGQEWLSSKFGTKFIDKNKWPPRSPDLNPCDYFLWGYLKERVYTPLPKNLDELKTNIERESKKISKDMLKRVFLNFRKRCEFIISAQGGHFEDK